MILYGVLFAGWRWLPAFAILRLYVWCAVCYLPFCLFKNPVYKFHTLDINSPCCSWSCEIGFLVCGQCSPGQKSCRYGNWQSRWKLWWGRWSLTQRQPTRWSHQGQLYVGKRPGGDIRWTRERLALTVTVIMWCWYNLKFEIFNFLTWCPQTLAQSLPLSAPHSPGGGKVSKCPKIYFHFISNSFS